MAIVLEERIFVFEKDIIILGITLGTLLYLYVVVLGGLDENMINMVHKMTNIVNELSIRKRILMYKLLIPSYSHISLEIGGF